MSSNATITRPLPSPRTTTHRPPLELAARPGESALDTARRLSTALAPERRFLPHITAAATLPGEAPLALLGPGGDFTRTIDASPHPTNPDPAACAVASANAAATDDAPRVVTRGFTRSQRNGYAWTTAQPPTVDAIVEAQRRLGYAPEGYGGPLDVTHSILPDGRNLTVWQSYANCD